jgi:hypothetical protein
MGILLARTVELLSGEGAQSEFVRIKTRMLAGEDQRWRKAASGERSGHR